MDNSNGSKKMKSNRVIMVTGGTGLVGKGIQLYLEKEKKDKQDEWVFLSSKEGDLRDLQQTKAIFEKYHPTHVIHLAALVGGLFKNMKEKLRFFRENMSINDNVLLCCHEFGVKKCISMLSTCIFPDKVSYPIFEEFVHDGPPHPSNEGYAYAKRMVDVLSRLYNESSSPCKFTTVVPTNIYGPYDNFNLEDSHVIPGLIHKCYLAKKQNEEFVVWGSGKPLRQFIFSIDLGGLLVWSLDNYEDDKPLILSVGEEDEVSIRQVAELIAEAMNYKKKLKFDETKADGQFKKTAGNSKLKKLYPGLKFTPITEALKETVQWFEENYESARL